MSEYRRIGKYPGEDCGVRDRERKRINVFTMEEGEAVHMREGLEATSVSIDNVKKKQKLLITQNDASPGSLV